MIAGKREEFLMKIGTFQIGKNFKRVVTSLFCGSSSILLEMFNRSELPSDRIYEIRYDLFKTRSIPDVSRMVESLNSIGISYIFTFRGERKEVLEYGRAAVDAGAPAVDIDHSFVNSFNPGNTSLVTSVHLYDSQPSTELLKELFQGPGSMVKVAVRYSAPSDFLQDAARISLLRQESDKPLALVPMGSNSASLRIASLMLISDFAYARYETETAEGQPLYRDYTAILKIAGL